MSDPLSLIAPQIVPPLDPGFRPAVLANRAFREALGSAGVPLSFALLRDGGKITHYSTQVFPEGHPQAASNLAYAERLLKFLLWSRGGYSVYIAGPASVASYLQRCYASGGERQFDAHFMGEQVYQQPFTIQPCDFSQLPAAYEPGETLGRHLDGCRIGFDLGASDRKASAVVDGQVVYSEEVVWEPVKQADPGYHYEQILAGLRSAASKMDRLDAVGGSSAGIIIDNEPRAASLFRAVPPQRMPEVRGMFARLGRELGVPVVVFNDGDVAALAGSMSLEENGVLGIALGSSEAGGYIDPQGHLLGWLNELGFAPIDYQPRAAVDEWSGDRGCGVQYFSQQCVFRLAAAAGIEVPQGVPDAERLKSVQARLEAGHPGAVQIWESIGIYLGYALAHYAEFYAIRHVLLLGRVTSGRGGDLILAGARAVLETEFPELAQSLQVQLPDERSRRVGQSIAAASLPSLG